MSLKLVLQPSQVSIVNKRKHADQFSLHSKLSGVAGVMCHKL
jgi:hypothetical protein